MEMLKLLAGLREVVDKQERMIEVSRLALHAAVLEAHGHQVPVPAIAKASGYTRARIYQILKGARQEGRVNE